MKIDEIGAEHIGKALQINTALTTLKCALASPQSQHALALLSARGADVRDCSWFDHRRLRGNKIGEEGAQHIGEAFKENTTLTTLECALTSPTISLC